MPQRRKTRFEGSSLNRSKQTADTQLKTVVWLECIAVRRDWPRRRFVGFAERPQDMLNGQAGRHVWIDCLEKCEAGHGTARREVRSLRPIQSPDGTGVNGKSSVEVIHLQTSPNASGGKFEHTARPGSYSVESDAKSITMWLGASGANARDVLCAKASQRLHDFEIAGRTGNGAAGVIDTVRLTDDASGAGSNAGPITFGEGLRRRCYLSRTIAAPGCVKA